MQNFSEKDVMDRLHALEHAAERHVPAGVGTESDLEARVAALEVSNEKLTQEVFGVAGIGAAQTAGVTVDAKELAAKDVGKFVQRPVLRTLQEIAADNAKSAQSSIHVPNTAGNV